MSIKKYEMKEDLLKMLKKQMKDSMGEDKGPGIQELLPKSEEMTKITIAGDSPEAVEEGLSKAQEIMKAKFSEKKDKKKK